MAKADGPDGGMKQRRATPEGAAEESRAFWLEAYRDFLSLEAGNARHTVENYGRDIRRMISFLVSRGTRDPKRVDPRILREFIFHLKDLGLAPASIRRQISASRSYFRFLVAEGHLAADPSGQLETPKAWRKLQIGRAHV